MVATTKNGVAEAAVTVDRTGQLDISIQADPVPRTIAMQITIQEGQVDIVVPNTPTPSPTVVVPTPVPTKVPEPVLENTPSPTPEPMVQEEEPPVADGGVGLLDLVLALLGVAIASGVGYYLVRLNNGPVTRALRLVLWCVVSGTVLYTAYALRIPGAAWLRNQSGVWAAGWITLFGSAVPIAIARVADRRR